MAQGLRFIKANRATPLVTAPTRHLRGVLNTPTVGFPLCNLRWEFRSVACIEAIFPTDRLKKEPAAPTRWFFLLVGYNF